MAPLPANSTDRFFLDYVTNNTSSATEHTMGVRLKPTAGADGAAIWFVTLLQGIGASNLYAGWRPIRLRYQAGGSNFTVPVGLGNTLSAFVGTASLTSIVQSREAVEVTLQARSYTTGRRTDISIYGTTVNTGNFRYAIGAANAPTWLTAAFIDSLNQAGQPAIAVDGTEVRFYPYVNVNYNSYWETRLRSV